MVRAGRRASRPLRILLAEDNNVNQKVALALLTKWGHVVSLASDGREALALWRPGAFDAVLMDLQMPSLDGFEATAAIRRIEESGGARVPILALTARALADDRERCLRAGMDAHFSKPLNADALFNALESLGAPRGQDQQGGAGEPSAEVPFDLAGALARVEGDEGLLDEVIETFLASKGQKLEEIRAAVNTGDCDELGRAAHALKGAISLFGAGGAYAAAARLEEIGRKGTAVEASEWLAKFEPELDVLCGSLITFLEKDVPETPERNAG